MQTSLSAPAPVVAPRVSALGLLSAVAVAGVAATLIYVSVAVLGFGLMPGVIIGLCLLSAGLVFTGWRWAPALGLLPTLPVVALLVPMALGDTGSPLFPAGLLLATFGVLAAVLGVAAVAQNYRRPAGERALPRFAVVAIALVAGAALGAQLLALAPKAGLAAGVSPEMMASLPAVQGKDWEFSQKELRVRAGETVALRLENVDPEAHSFDIDELDVHAPIPVDETGLALFKASAPGTYTFYCEPHYNKETGEGMKGTLIVE